MNRNAIERRTRRARREELEMLAVTLRLIEGEQRRRQTPWQQATVDAIVSTELRRLEQETGVSLDDLADDWRYHLSLEDPRKAESPR